MEEKLKHADITDKILKAFFRRAGQDPGLL
jgi:hypothetical protein